MNIQYGEGLLEWHEDGYKRCIHLALVTSIAEGRDAGDKACVWVSMMDGCTRAFKDIPYHILRDAWYAYSRGDEYEVPQ